jgi:hypothetical protein
LYKNITQLSKLDYILKNLLYFIFFVFTFFPFITVIDLGTDMQPYGLVVALILFFFFKNITLNKAHICLLLIFFFSFIVFLSSEINFASSRSFFNYIQLFLVSYVGYQILKTERINFEFFLKSTILIWLIVGFIQAFVDKTFLTFLIRDPRLIGESRGVVSLAAEPTFYGIVLLFLILFLLHTNYKNKILFIFICTLGIIFVAKSSMVFLLLIIAIFFYFITHFNISSIFYMTILIVVVPFLILEFMQESRIAHLINLFSTQPSSMLAKDFSITDRLFHVFFSLKGFYDNFMLPNGFLSWEVYMSSQIKEYTELGIISSDYANHPARARGGRIMSGYGSAFFELGIIAVLIPISLIILYYSLYKDDLKKFFFFSLLVNAIMFTGIPIGFCIFAFYIGFLSYLIQKKVRVV